MQHLSKCSHEENRKKVCAACGKKISFGKRKPEEFLINEKHEELIRKLHNPNFDLKEEKFPLSICLTCRTTHLEHDKGIFKRPLQNMPNYADIVLPKPTRSNEGECNCYICLTGRYTGHLKIKKGRGHKRNLFIKMDQQANGPHGRSHSNIVCLPKNQIKENVNTSVTLCRSCYQEIGKGKRHNCGTPVKNVVNWIESFPENQKDQIITSTLKRKLLDNKNKCDGQRDTRLQHTECRLSSIKGPQMKVSVNPKKPKLDPTFSTENLDSFYSNAHLSQREMNKLTNFIRCNVGRKSIPKYYEKHVAETSKSLDHLYGETELEFDVENNGREKRPVIYADASKLLDSIIEKRNLVGNVNIKVMADNGQGFFKVSMSVFPESYASNNDCANVKRKSLYSEGGTIGKTSVMTSVNKLILLSVVPQIKETYTNIKIIFDLITLNAIPFKFASDFKIILIVNGQQTAAASYPCPYCFVKLSDLKNRYKETTDKTALKTYGNLKEDYKKFSELENTDIYGNVAKECNSTVHRPLFEEDDNVCVIQKCVIPELHILQGFVNHLFWKGLVKLVGRDRALIWPRKLHLVSKKYQGETFEGNACRKMLKKADQLQDPAIYGDLGPLALMPFISAFKDMDKIVNRYFATKKIDHELDTHINNLRKTFAATEVSKSLKIHVVLEHMADCLRYLDGEGLGLWSEQAGESIHRIFLKCWNKFKINQMEHTSYSHNLKRAVVEFSSLHL